jgi:alpha-tubulin suppressor-like RCC1 family protein
LGLSDVVAIAAGFNHTCALVSNGEVRCWGANGYGQLGLGDLVNRSSPLTVPGIPATRAITCGYQHTCAIAAGDGQTMCWGWNDAGQLGDGSLVSRSVAAPVLGLSRFSGMVGGGFHTCALTPSAAVYCWGANEAGQLGKSGDAESVPTPVSAFACSGGKS